MPDATDSSSTRAVAQSRVLVVDRLFSLLSRESSTGQFIAEIDGLRFVAIMSVILYHLNGFVVNKLALDWRSDPLSPLLDKGNFGVQLFFVISGFIIAYPFAQRLLTGRPAVSLGRYLTRRLTRLEPPYIINLTVVLILLVTVRGESLAELWPHLLASVTYLHNVIYGKLSLINGVAWSLEIECQFYLLAPLLVSVFRVRSVVRRRALLVTAIVAGSCAGQFVFAGNPRWELSILNFLGFFLTGFLLADFHLVSWKGDPPKSWIWDLGALACWVAIVRVLYAPPAWHVILPLPILGAYCGAFLGPVNNRFFRNRLIFTIGGMCYTIYLYHFFVISMVGRFALRSPFIGVMPVWCKLILIATLVVPSVIVICSALFLLTEKPFMRRNWHLALRDRLALAVERQT